MTWEGDVEERLRSLESPETGLTDDRHTHRRSHQHRGGRWMDAVIGSVPRTRLLFLSTAMRACMGRMK